MELLRKNNMKEATKSIFEMAAYVDAIEKKWIRLNGLGLRETGDVKRPAS